MHRRPRLTRPCARCGALAGAASLLVVASAAACSGSEAVQPAPSASAAACTTALAAAPATVLGKARTPLDVAGALAYGEPPIVVRCGLAAPGPSPDRCLELDGTDWLLTSADEAVPVVLVSFGRDPAVEVTVPGDYGRENASAAAIDLAPVARALPSNGRACQGL